MSTKENVLKKLGSITQVFFIISSKFQASGWLSLEPFIRVLSSAAEMSHAWAIPLFEVGYQHQLSCVVQDCEGLNKF